MAKDLHAFFASSLCSFTISSIFFSCLTDRFPDSKRKSWIITFLSSIITSLGSIPFVLDFILSGGKLQAVQPRMELAHTVTGAFQGLLIADLLIGCRKYPDRVSLTLGWIHHIAYSAILPYIASRGWAHIFCACLSMEIPTLMIATSFLWPRFRNDILCAVVFFAMRIVLHVAFLIAAVKPSQRDLVVNGSWLPALVLVLAFGMHVSWFQSSVRGILRRRAAQSKLVTIAEVKDASIQHFRSFTTTSRLQTELLVRQFALKCRDVRKRVTLRRSARRALVTAFPIMLANLQSERSLTSMREYSESSTESDY